MPAQTITQGQSFTDTGGRSGVAQFDPNTGAKLSTGQSVTVNPVANTSPTTSTGQAPVQAKPAPAVISSAPAQGFINNIATPAFNNLQQGIQNQAVANGYNDTTHLLPGETLDAYNVRVASVNKTKAATPAPVAPAPTQQDAAATKIANTPDVGNKYVYDPTGQRHEIALAGPVPAGYSTTAPANPTLNGHAPIGQVVNAGNGQMYQAYSDGTFGLLGPDGKFSYGVSAAEFNNAQQTDPKNVLADLQSKIANLSTATIPLQPWQQNGLTALSNSVASVIASEQQANTNYTGAMTDLVNLQGTGNSAVGIGLIKSTIDSGLAKISKLQSDNDLAVSKMEQAFREENYKQIFDSYTAQANIEKDISAEITTMHQFALKTQEDADAQAENVRNFNYKVSQDSVTNLREDALAKSTISRNSSDIQKNKAEIAKIYSDITTANKNSNLTLGLPGGVVPIASDGKADPVYQKQFLDNLAKNNPGLAGTVKGYAEYRFPMGANTFKSKEGQQLLSLIAQYNPAFDSDNYTSRQAVVKSFASGSSGSDGSNVTSLNTTIGHLATLKSRSDAMGNTPVPGINYLVNAYKNSTGGSTLGLDQDIAAVKDELLKTFAGKAPTDQQVALVRGFDKNASPAQIKDFIQQSSQLLASRLDALNTKYQTNTQVPPPTPTGSWMSNEASNTLSQLKNQGYVTDLPGVLYTDPAAYVKNIPDASTKLDTARKMLIQQNLPTDPASILQAAQSLP